MSTTAESGVSTVESGNLEAKALDTVRNHVYVSMGFGLLPIPGFDMISIGGTQLDMVRKLANIYGHTFKSEAVKASIAALVGTFTPIAFAGPVSSLLKLVPILGSTAGGLSLAMTAGASTYAVGKVFIQHFEAGGTLLDFNPSEMKNYFAEHYGEGMKVASEAKKA